MKSPPDGKIKSFLAQCMALDVRGPGLTMRVKVVLRSILKHCDHWPGAIATRSRSFPLAWIAGDMEREEAVVSRSLPPLIAAGLINATRLTNGYYSITVFLDRLVELQATEGEVIEASRKGRRSVRKPRLQESPPGDENVAYPGDENVAISDLLLSEVAPCMNKSASPARPAEGAPAEEETKEPPVSEAKTPGQKDIDQLRGLIGSKKPKRTKIATQPSLVEQAALLGSFYEAKRKRLDNDFSLRTDGKSPLLGVAKRLIERRIFPDRWKEYVGWVFEEWVQWGGEDRAPWPPLRSLGYEHYVEKWTEQHPMELDLRHIDELMLKHGLPVPLSYATDAIVQAAYQIVRGEPRMNYTATLFTVEQFWEAAQLVADNMGKIRWREQRFDGTSA